MQRKMRHSKFKNTGILFELLTRKVTADIIAGKDTSIAKDLLYKYFKENTELGREWQLYSELLNEKIKDEVHAERLLTVVVDTRRKIDNHQLIQEKYELIKEIKNNYPIDEMLKSPVRNYRLLASIYKLFENSSGNNLKFEVKEVYQAKDCIVEHMVDKPKASYEDDLIKYYKNQSEEIRLLSYKLLVEKLNDKYNSSLNDEQKSVLREYICNVANTNQFGNYVKDRVSEIKRSLTETVGLITGGDVIKIKIREVIHQLDKINPGKLVRDNEVMTLMLSYELLKEIKKQTETSSVI